MGSGATSGLMVTRSIRGIPVSTMKVPLPSTVPGTRVERVPVQTPTLTCPE